MMGRDRRNSRPNIKTRVGIATAVLVGGGAIGVAAMAASHGASPAAQSAGYSSRISHSHYTSEWSQLNSAITSWGTSRMNTLASMTKPTYTQTAMHGKTLAEQRGIVVLATHNFLIVQSADGSLHLWLLSGRTTIQNVANNTAGTHAMTGNSSATTQAMQSGNMIPATTLMAGSPLTASHLLTPARFPETVTVQVAGTDLTVTVTITKTTATVSSTATTPWNGNPAWNPSTFTQPAWTTATSSSMLARGDLVLVVGSRSHNLLHAQVVLYTPLTTEVVGGGGSGVTPKATTPTQVRTSPTGVSGTHY
jgi:hypothetical protein